MLIWNTAEQTLFISEDVYKRASTGDFLAAVNEQIPGLTMTEDRAIAIAYALAQNELEGGAAQRELAVRAGASYGFDPEDRDALLDLGYQYLLPALAPLRVDA